MNIYYLVSQNPNQNKKKNTRTQLLYFIYRILYVHARLTKTVFVCNKRLCVQMRLNMCVQMLI